MLPELPVLRGLFLPGKPRKITDIGAILPFCAVLALDLLLIGAIAPTSAMSISLTEMFGQLIQVESNAIGS